MYWKMVHIILNIKKFFIIQLDTSQINGTSSNFIKLNGCKLKDKDYNK